MPPLRSSHGILGQKITTLFSFNLLEKRIKIFSGKIVVTLRRNESFHPLLSNQVDTGEMQIEVKYCLMIDSLDFQNIRQKIISTLFTHKVNMFGSKQTLICVGQTS